MSAIQLFKRTASLLAIVVLLGTAASYAATWGTVIPTGGHISDIALDERRGVLYMANLGGNRVDVLSTQTLNLMDPIRDLYAPSSLALSPNARYLAVVHFVSGDYQTGDSRVTILDLDANVRRPLATLPGKGLAVAFGNSPLALVVTTSGFYLVDPVTGELTRRAEPVISGEIPACFGTVPNSLTLASTAVSGDGNVITVVAGAAPTGEAGGGTSTTPPSSSGCSQGGADAGSDVSVIAKLNTRTGEFRAEYVSASPKLGPRVVSTDATGEQTLVGWALLKRVSAFYDRNYLAAQFPRATGEYSRGGYAFDSSRNLIFGDVPDTAFTAAKDVFGDSAGFPEAVMQVFSTDNLTVEERLRIPEGLSGRAIFNAAMDRLYAISSSGVTVFDMGRYQQLPRLRANKEDLTFKSNGCDRNMVATEFDIVDPSGQSVDFTFKVPSGVSGLRVVPSSGTTPAKVRVEVDPVAFQERKGTTQLMLEVLSNRAVNIPRPIRLLINTRDPDQRGTLVNVPGNIVDMIADPYRNRAYLLRQDTNEVLVYDTDSEKVVARLRTGNTPVGMAITPGGDRLLVGNDNSGYISAFDLSTLQPSAPITTQIGFYPRTVAALWGSIWATARTASGTPEGVVLRADLYGQTAVKPERLGIYSNSIKKDSAVATSPTGNVMLIVQPDGTVIRYEGIHNGFSASRVDYAGLSGAFGAMSDDLFGVGAQLLNRSLVPIHRIDGRGTPSGFASANGWGLFAYSRAATGPGVIQKINMDRLTTVSPTWTAESPSTSEMMKYPPIGQIGQTILPFTRTIAPLRDGQSILLLTASGITKLPTNFDAPIASPVLSSVTNVADGTGSIGSGALVRISGRNLTEHPESVSVPPYPTSLGDVCATVNSIPVPMYRINETNIYAQVPQAASGSSTLVVRTAGGSATHQFNVLPSAPAVFRSAAGETSGAPLIYRAANAQMVTGTNPVRVNDTLVIYGTGIGATSPSVPDGHGAPGAPPARASSTPVVTLGGVALRVDFAGLVPELVGVSQMNVAVPADVPEGMQVPLRIKSGSYEAEMNVRVVKP